MYCLIEIIKLLRESVCDAMGLGKLLWFCNVRARNAAIVYILKLVSETLQLKSTKTMKIFFLEFFCLWLCNNLVVHSYIYRYVDK